LDHQTLSKDITTIITNTSKLREMLEPLKPPLMPVLKPQLLLPLKPRLPLLKRCQLLKKSRLKLLLSSSQRLLINQLKPKEPGPNPELMMPPKLPQLHTTMLLVKKSSPICIELELKIN
jgi:hypothetical protein